MPWLRRLIRLPLLVLHLLLGVFLTVLVVRGDPRRLPPLSRRVVQWWLGAIATVLGVRVTVAGEPGPGPVLMTSPHLSWLDIAVLGGADECVFLSKEEVRRWPVVGWLAARAGTLFISRGLRHSMEAAVADIATVLGRGRRVVIFPEGTTTDGTLRRFKGRLLQAAIDAGVPVQPVMLRYPGNGGTHPQVPFVGDTSLVEHIWELSAARGVRAEVAYLAPIPAAGHTPRELTRHAERAVREALARPHAGRAEGLTPN